MPRGDKSSYTDKQKRQADHIEQGYEDRGTSHAEAERRAAARKRITKARGAAAISAEAANRLPPAPPPRRKDGRRGASTGGVEPPFARGGVGGFRLLDGLCFARRAGRSADHQLGRQHSFAHRRQGIVEQIEQHAHRLFAQFALGLRDRRQRGIEEARELDIVKPGDRHILRHAEATCTKTADRAQCHFVAAAKDRAERRSAGEQGFDRAHARFGAEIARDDQPLVRRDVARCSATITESGRRQL